jgi:hypothetical protein
VSLREKCEVRERDGGKKKGRTSSVDRKIISKRRKPLGLTSRGCAVVIGLPEYL